MVTVYRVVSKHVTWPRLFTMSLVSAGVGIATGWWLSESSDAEEMQERAATSVFRAADLLQSP